MEYQFKQNPLARPEAHFSLGHEAFAAWFSDELQGPTSQYYAVRKASHAILHKQQTQAEFHGREYSLQLSYEGASMLAHALAIDSCAPLPEECDYFDEQQHAECGLEDFYQALLAWGEFINV